MIRTLPNLWRRWRQSRRAAHRLDVLLAQADPSLELAERNQWLIELAHWLHDGGTLEDGLDGEVAYPPHARLRYLLHVLRRNPAWRATVGATLRATLDECDTVSLLCDTGMPTRAGLWGAFVERVQAALIPAAPNTHNLSALVSLMFYRERDAEWLREMPPALVSDLCELLREGHDGTAPDSASGLSASLLAAMNSLACQIASTGLSQPVRVRLDERRIEALPFYRLGRAMQAVGDAYDAAYGAAPSEALAGPPNQRLLQEVNYLRGLLDHCQAACRDLYAHLDANGVSVDVVFQVERMRARIDRLELLLEVWLMAGDTRQQARLIGDLVQASSARQSVSRLFRDNFALLARKMVESCAQTGDHYIARDRREYLGMLRMAAGGGALTAVTVYIKFFVVGAHLQPMVEGFLAGLNYALSFVLMHFLHFTLATKQPAMTAPALAGKLDELNSPHGFDALAGEVIALARTQAAAILGNVLLVFPLCLLIELAWQYATGGHLISVQKARATLDAFSLLGATPLYAAGTGVLLWLSSLLAGWAENWFALHRLGDVLAYHRRLRLVFGVRGAQRLSAFWRRNFSPIVSNLGLGMLLGLAPPLLTAFALPFEVRHVTLSAGSIATALGVLGPGVLDTAAFWWAVAGLASMAVLNVTVSFALALSMALRSRPGLTVRRGTLLRALLRRLAQHPFELFLPLTPRQAAPKQ